MLGAPPPPASPHKVPHKHWAPLLCSRIRSLISISTNTGSFKLIYQFLRHLTNIPTSHRNTHSLAPLKSNPFPNTDGWLANSLMSDAALKSPSPAAPAGSQPAITRGLGPEPQAWVLCCSHPSHNLSPPPPNYVPPCEDSAWLCPWGLEVEALLFPVLFPHPSDGKRKAAHCLRTAVKSKLVTKEAITQEPPGLGRVGQKDTFSTLGTSLKMQCLLTAPEPRRAVQGAITNLACPSLAAPRVQGRPGSQTA